MFKKYLSSRGFTLVELIVVIAILSVLMVVSIMLFNPLLQLDKAKDAQRKHDFEQIKVAADSYYNDHNCYPTQAQNIPFGQEWTDPVSGTVYMKTVPQDPDCFKTGSCYVYQTDAGNCPQWNVLYAHLSVKLSASELLKSCPLRNVCGVVFPKYNYCVFSGNLDCSYIKSNPMPTPNFSSPTPTPMLTPTPTPGGGATPTPTPSPPPGACSCAGAPYDMRAGNCNAVDNAPYNYCDPDCLIHCKP
jgi:prepilin-type N-terminal cleavage/methylation domain-containing protein